MVIQLNQNQGNRGSECRLWEGAMTRYEIPMGKETQEVRERTGRNQEQQLPIQTMETSYENLNGETYGHYPNLRKILEKRARVQPGKGEQVLRLCGTEDMKSPKQVEGGGQNKIAWGEYERERYIGPIINELPGTDEPMREVAISEEQTMDRICPYIVETPDSPTEAWGQIIAAPTGLSPLMMKVNLKRKYEEETDSETEEREEQAVKKRRGMEQEEDQKNQKSRSSPRGKKQSKKGSGVRRKIIPSKNRETGSGSCPQTATRNQ